MIPTHNITQYNYNYKMYLRNKKVIEELLVNSYSVSLGQSYHSEVYFTRITGHELLTHLGSILKDKHELTYHDTEIPEIKVIDMN